MPLTQKQLTENRLLRTIGGLSLGGLLLAVYLNTVGVGEIRRALAAIPPQRILSLLIVGSVPLVAWGIGLYLVFDQLGVTLRPVTSVSLYGASGFLNSVTPFGQVGGDPVSAVLFGWAVETDFETGLTAIGGLNALNRIAAVVLGLLGVGYLSSRLTASGTLRNAAVLVTGLSIVVALGLVMSWRYRHRLLSVLARILTPFIRSGTRIIPGVTPPTREAIERRGYRFIKAIDRLASEPRRLGVVFALSLAGQLAVAATLWIALAALGFDASLAVVLLIVPLGKLAGIALTPGGSGSSEVLLSVLLVSITGVSAPIASAGVFLYRASVFWFTSLVGGLITGWFVAVGGRTEPEQSQSVLDGNGAMLAPDADESSTTPVSSMLPKILIALSASLAVLVTIVIHKSRLVIEPNSIVVHGVQDTSLVVLCFALAWAMLYRLPRGWLG